MTKIKICGLSRMEDITYVNQAQVDFAGFIIHFPKSHRSIGVEQLKKLRKHLHQEIQAVGVFVNESVEFVAAIAEADLIDWIQLHGTEDEAYIKRLRVYTKKPMIQAFLIQSEEDVRRAQRSSADYILLDAGQGSGGSFDWTLLKEVKRPYFLAGGISALNVKTALKNENVFAIDVSSGVEVNGKKEKEKILELVEIVKNEQEEK